MQITTHFSLAEMTHTDTGLYNEAPLEDAGNLLRLCEEVLEPIRDLLQTPLIIHSGYRSPRVNRAVGGDPNSAHLEGRAADFHPSKLPIRASFDHIRLSNIPYDKLILEERLSRGVSSWWIHVQVARQGIAPRRKAYIAPITDTGRVYHDVSHA